MSRGNVSQERGTSNIPYGGKPGSSRMWPRICRKIVIARYTPNNDKLHIVYPMVLWDTTILGKLQMLVLTTAPLFLKYLRLIQGNYVSPKPLRAVCVFFPMGVAKKAA